MQKAAFLVNLLNSLPDPGWTRQAIEEEGHAPHWTPLPKLGLNEWCRGRTHMFNCSLSREASRRPSLSASSQVSV